MNAYYRAAKNLRSGLDVEARLDAAESVAPLLDFLFAAHYLETVLPDAFLVMTGLGSMGQSIGAAIGAQLANPGRVVAVIDPSPSRRGRRTACAWPR